MSVVYALGFENNSTTAGHEYDTSSGTGITIVSNAHGGGFGGQRNLRVVRSGAAGISYIQHQFGATGNTDRIWIHSFAFQLVTAFSATNSIYQIFGAIVNHTSLRITTGNVLQAFKDDTNSQIGSDGPVLQTGRWYWITISYDPSNGAVKVWLNNRLVITGTGGVTQSNRLFRMGLNTSVTGEALFDDVVIGHNVGTYNITNPLPTFLVAVRPNADGDQNDTTGTFADVDEETADDATTLAVLDLDAGNEIFDVNILDYPTLPGWGFIRVPFITVNLRERSQSNAAESWVLRIKSQASGTVAESGTYTHNDTSFRTNGDALPLIPFVSETDPQNGKPWQSNRFAGIQIGVRSIDAAPDIEMTQLWAYIAFQPYPRLLAAQGVG